MREIMLGGDWNDLINVSVGYEPLFVSAQGLV